ncbi:MAG: transcriptional regulator [Deltaproteobacteria bacterium CG_4_10_14_3_um_filter_60_8]|nr:MAG: transcriptional regulator [Deltaproteobacteria bacterium CG_4_10_14_3_um_filter_60_8]
MRAFIRVMKALSDPNRVKIVKMIQAREMCVCEIRAALGLAQPTISKHLKVLEDAGLVTSRKDGLFVNYRVTAKPENEYGRAMLAVLSAWLNDDKGVRRLLARLPGIDRLTILKRACE